MVDVLTESLPTSTASLYVQILSTSVNKHTPVITLTSNFLLVSLQLHEYLALLIPDFCSSRAPYLAL